MYYSNSSSNRGVGVWRRGEWKTCGFVENSTSSLIIATTGCFLVLFDLFLLSFSLNLTLGGATMPDFKHNQITLLFAADIHKDKHHFLVSIKELHKPIDSFILDNSSTGFSLFINKIILFSKKFNTHNIIFAFEPSSNFWNEFRLYSLLSYPYLFP